MSLTRDTLHPARRHYVLKLDRLADPARGVLSGRVENLATGRVFDFEDARSFTEGLARDLAQERDEAQEPPAAGSG